jgi:hypothetical protein
MIQHTSWSFSLFLLYPLYLRSRHNCGAGVQRGGLGGHFDARLCMERCDHHRQPAGRRAPGRCQHLPAAAASRCVH